MSDYLYCSLDSAGILKFYKAITKPLDLCMRQNRKTNLSIRLTDDCKNNLRRKRSTLLLLTWMPSFLMVPNRLNSSSNCCGVAFKGRFRTYMACASTLKMIRKHVRWSQHAFYLQVWVYIIPSGSWKLPPWVLGLKAGASATREGAGGACFSGFGGAGLERTAGAGGRYSFMTFT